MATAGKIILYSLYLMIFLWQSLNFTGFCYKKQRFLTNDELIKYAVLYEIKSNISSIYQSSQSNDELVKVFFDEYGRKCCSIYHWSNAWEPMPLGILGTTFGFHVSTIFINYEDKSKMISVHEMLAIDMCGNIRERSGEKRDLKNKWTHVF